jgi:hypothetical protein
MQLHAKGGGCNPEQRPLRRTKSCHQSQHLRAVKVEFAPLLVEDLCRIPIYVTN